MKNLPSILKLAALSSALFAVGAHASPTYKFKVWAPGVKASAERGPSTPAPSGKATGLLEPLVTEDFGTVSVGQSAVLDFKFTNVGDGVARDLRAVVAGEGLQVEATDCGTTDALVNLGTGQSCGVSVRYAPLQAAPLQGTLAIGGAYSNSPSSLTLRGQGQAQAEGVLTANISTDFGTLTPGTSASRSFTFRNPGALAATSVFAAITQTSGLSIAANTCGTASAPVTVGAGASCSITLTYGGSTASSLEGATVAVSGAFAGGSQVQALSGSIGTFNAQAVWSSSPSSEVAFTEATSAYGIKTMGSATAKTMYMRNVGANGAQATGFVLSGDTAHFAITEIRAMNAGGNVFYDCSGGAIAANRLSVSPCVAQDPATGSYKNILVTVNYTPKAVGVHNITVTPTSNNGTKLPGALTFAGEARFNPTLAWTSLSSSLVAPTAADLSYGQKSGGTSTSKTIYLRNIGTHGAAQAGFTLSGDVSHFAITTVTAMNTYGTTGTSCGSSVSNDRSSATLCNTNDVATGSYPHMAVVVSYVPKAGGNHSVTITPNTSNGTQLPEPITLTGAQVFNAAANWSSSGGSIVAPTPAYLAYGTKGVGSNTAKTIYVRNSGTNGQMSVGFTLSGDTSHFTINSVSAVNRNGNVTSGCAAGGAVATNRLSATPCTGQDPSLGSYSEIVLTVTYSPKSAGSHSVTVTPSTGNGTAIPAPLVLDGSAP